MEKELVYSARLVSLRTISALILLTESFLSDWPEAVHVAPGYKLKNDATCPLQKKSGARPAIASPDLSRALYSNPHS